MCSGHEYGTPIGLSFAQAKDNSSACAASDAHTSTTSESKSRGVLISPARGSVGGINANLSSSNSNSNSSNTKSEQAALGQGGRRMSSLLGALSPKTKDTASASSAAGHGKSSSTATPKASGKASSKAKPTDAAAADDPTAAEAESKSETVPETEAAAADDETKHEAKPEAEAETEGPTVAAETDAAAEPNAVPESNDVVVDETGGLDDALADIMALDSSFTSNPANPAESKKSSSAAKEEADGELEGGEAGLSIDLDWGDKTGAQV